VYSGRSSLIGTGRILHCCPPATPGLTGVPSHIFTKKQKYPHAAGESLRIGGFGLSFRQNAES
ncbi:hypothetical protein, partial [Trichococcus flocculiformis]|uniref:hypothetical protein n=1 Tax=Trichococcus flocculiformis TaxID=82803 RepID=UPI0023F3DA18